MSETPLPSWPTGVHELRLGAVSIDLRYRRVTSSAGTVELPQRPFDLLCVFLAEPNVLHTRPELFTRVWKNVIVEDANLSQSVWLVRNALGEAKPWLRTVARSGYVFEPPVPLEALGEAPATIAVVTPDGSSVEPPAGPSHRLGVRALCALLAVIVAVAAAAWLLMREHTGRTGPTRVVLVELDRREDSPAIRPHWSLALLRAWLEWRLSSEPDAVVVEAARQGRMPESGDMRVVLLSAELDGTDPSRLRLAAHLATEGATHSFGGSGALADVAPRIDVLSREVVAALVRQPVALETPPLDLDADAAKRYTDALALKAARRPADAVAAFDAVIAAAPSFGLAYAQQAELLGELGRMRRARERFDQAAPWVARLPPTAVQIALARQRMAERDFRAAQTAYADLSARYPDQPLYVMEKARALLADRQIDAALATLSTVDWERQPPALLAGSLILRANIRLQNRDDAHARQDALRAGEIAARNDWALQRAQAQLAVAQITPSDPAGFDEAAREFDRAGDLHAALRARIQAEVGRPDSDGAELRALLQEAHAAGDSNLEVFGLRAEAMRRMHRGEPAATRELLTRAKRVVEDAGDMKYATAVPYELLQAIYLQGDFAAFDSALAQIDIAGLHGIWRTNIGEMAAAVAFRRGRFADVDAAVRRFAQPPDSQVPEEAGVDVTYGCIRAETALRRGDIPAAQTEAGRCGASGSPAGVVARELALTRIAVPGGSASDPLRSLDAVDAALHALSDDLIRWGPEILAAQRRLEAGDIDGAAAALANLRERKAALGTPTLRADLLLSSAECAVAHDRLADAAHWLDQAKALLPADDWIGGSRARIVEAVLAWRHGATDGLEALQPLVTQARERGDAWLVIAVMSLLSPDDATTNQLRTRTGLRNVSLRWLLGSAGAGRASN